MQMKKLMVLLSGVIAIIVLTPAVLSLATTLSNGTVTDFGANQLQTNFGMLTGSVQFKLGNFLWSPKEIWLLPSEIDPDIFAKGLSQQDVVEIPENVTWSTCRTAVYLNKTVGYG